MPLFHLAPLDLRPDDSPIHLSTTSSLFPLPTGKTTNFKLPPLELDRDGEFTDPIAASTFLTAKAQAKERNSVEIPLESDQTVPPKHESTHRLHEEESETKFSIVSWDNHHPNHPSASTYDSPFITEAPALILETLAFKTKDTRYDGQSYTHSQLLDENLFKVILGTESTLFAWDPTFERFCWRGESGTNAKGKGREGRLEGCTIGDTQLLVEPYLSLGSTLVRLETIVRDLTSSSPSDQSTSASHSVGNALSTFCTYARQELSLLTKSDSSSFLSLSTQFSPLASTLEKLLQHFQRPLGLSPPYPSYIKLSARHLLSTLFDSLDEALKSSSPKLDQVVLAWLFDGVLRGWWRGWEEWVGISPSLGSESKGEAWRECGIEVRESLVDSGTEEVRKTDMRIHTEADVEYIFHTSQIPSFFPREIAMALFESGRALRILKRSSNALSIGRKEGIGYVIEGSGRGLIWDYEECSQYHDSVERAILENRGTSSTEVVTQPIRTPPPQDTPLPTEHAIPAKKYHSEIASLFSSFDVQPGTSPAPILSTPLTKFLSTLLSPNLNSTPNSMHSILPTQIPSLEILIAESLWSPLAPILRQTSSILLKRLFTHFNLREELRLLGRVWLFSDRCTGLALIETRGGKDGSGSGGGSAVGFMGELEDVLFRGEGYEDEFPGGRLLERGRKRDVIPPSDSAVSESGGGRGREERGIGLAVRLDWKGSSGVELSLALRECLARSVEGFSRPFSSRRNEDFVISSSTSSSLVKGVEHELTNGVEHRSSMGDGLGLLEGSGGVRRGEGRVEEKGLVDRLSFAFDFEKAVDSSLGTSHHKDSLKALSFLTLSYTPLSPLNLLITPKVLKQYSKFFSLVIVLLRIKKVLGGISRGVRDPLDSSSSMLMKREVGGKVRNGGDRYLFGEDEKTRRVLVGFSFGLMTTTRALLDYYFNFAISDSIRLFDKSISSFLVQLFPPPPPPSKSSSIPTPHATTPIHHPTPPSTTSSTKVEPTLNTLTTHHATHLKTLSTRLLLEKHQSGLLEIIEGIFGLVLRFGIFVVESRRSAEDTTIVGHEAEEEGERERASGKEEELREMENELEGRRKLLIKVLTTLSERGGLALGRSKMGRGGSGYADDLLSRLS